MRVMILGAGGNAGNNAARCAWQAGHSTLGVDTDPLMLGLSDCDQTQVIETQAGDPGHLAEVNELAAHHHVVWAQPDPEALWLAENRGSVNAAVCVPPARAVRLCQDKLLTAHALGDLAPRSGSLVDLPAMLFSHGEVWMRLRNGAGSAGALPVRDEATAKVWREHWATATGATFGDWMISEVLPGRDLSWTGVYAYGELVISVAKERLSLLGASRSPAQVSSTATAQTIVIRPDLNEICEDAVAAICDRPHGVFMVDARENTEQVPKVTEINAGRFGTTMDMWAECGPNLLDICIRLAVGQYDETGEGMGRRDEHIKGATWVRNTDCVGRIASRSRVALRAA